VSSARGDALATAAAGGEVRSDAEQPGSEVDRLAAGRDLGQQPEEGLLDQVVGGRHVTRDTGHSGAQRGSVLGIRGADAGADGHRGDRFPPCAPHTPVTARLPPSHPHGDRMPLKVRGMHLENLYFSRARAADS